MVIKIQKEQYYKITKKLLKSFFGKLSRDESFEGAAGTFFEVFDSNGRNIIDVWEKGPNVPKKCKNVLIFNLSDNLFVENFLPILRKKIFSEVLIDYVYEEIGFKCYCVKFPHSHIIEYDDEGYEVSRDYKKYTYRKK